MLEGIICPACENSIDEIDLKNSLKCPHCNTDLKDRRYLDFLEFLMANGIVENLDFFDQEVYSDDVDDLDQTKEEEVDTAEFEKKKDLGGLLIEFPHHSEFEFQVYLRTKLFELTKKYHIYILLVENFPKRKSRIRSLKKNLYAYKKGLGKQNIFEMAK